MTAWTEIPAWVADAYGSADKAKARVFEIRKDLLDRGFSETEARAGACQYVEDEADALAEDQACEALASWRKL